MIHQYILLAIGLLTVSSVMAQTTFSKSIDFESSDNGIDLITTEEGYYVLGLLGHDDDDLRCTGLLKTNLEGTVKWKKKYSMAPYNFESGVDALLKDGDLLLIGGATDSSGTDNMYLMAVDEQGEIIWSHHYDDSLRVVPRTLLKTNEGHYLLYGFRNINTNQSSEICLLAIDTDGNKLWEKSYAHNFHFANPWGIVQLDDGGLVMSYSYCSSPNGCAPYNTAVIRTDAQGNQLWTQTYNEVLKSNRVSKIIPLDNGGFALCWNKDFIFDPLYIDFHFPPVIYGLDSKGEIEWEYVFNSPSDSRKEIISMIKSPDGGIVGVGLQDRFATYDGVGGWLFNLSSSGQLLWERQFPSPYSPINHAEFHNIKTTPDNGYIICGLTQDTSMNNGTITNNNDFWLVKVDHLGCLTNNCDDLVGTTAVSPQIFPRVFPNPVDDYFNIELPKVGGNYYFTLYNTSGHLLKAWTQHESIQSISVGQWPTGMYLLKWLSEENNGTEKIIIR